MMRGSKKTMDQRRLSFEKQTSHWQKTQPKKLHKSPTEKAIRTVSTEFISPNLGKGVPNKISKRVKNEQARKEKLMFHENQKLSAKSGGEYQGEEKLRKGDTRPIRQIQNGFEANGSFGASRSLTNSTNCFLDTQEADPEGEIEGRGGWDDQELFQPHVQYKKENRVQNPRQNGEKLKNRRITMMGVLELEKVCFEKNTKNNNKNIFEGGGDTSEREICETLGENTHRNGKKSERQFTFKKGNQVRRKGAVSLLDFGKEVSNFEQTLKGKEAGAGFWADESKSKGSTSCRSKSLISMRTERRDERRGKSVFQARGQHTGVHAGSFQRRGPKQNEGGHGQHKPRRESKVQPQGSQRGIQMKPERPVAVTPRSFRQNFDVKRTLEKCRSHSSRNLRHNPPSIADNLVHKGNVCQGIVLSIRDIYNEREISSSRSHRLKHQRNCSLTDMSRLGARRQDQGAEFLGPPQIFATAQLKSSNNLMEEDGYRKSERICLEMGINATRVSRGVKSQNWKGKSIRCTSREILGPVKGHPKSRNTSASHFEGDRNSKVKFQNKSQSQRKKIKLKKQKLNSQLESEMRQRKSQKLEIDFLEYNHQNNKFKKQKKKKKKKKKNSNLKNVPKHQQSINLSNYLQQTQNQSDQSFTQTPIFAQTDNLFSKNEQTNKSRNLISKNQDFLESEEPTCPRRNRRVKRLSIESNRKLWETQRREGELTAEVAKHTFTFKSKKRVGFDDQFWSPVEGGRFRKGSAGVTGRRGVRVIDMRPRSCYKKKGVTEQKAGLGEDQLRVDHATYVLRSQDVKVRSSVQKKPTDHHIQDATNPKLNEQYSKQEFWGLSTSNQPKPIHKNDSLLITQQTLFTEQIPTPVITRESNQKSLPGPLTPATTPNPKETLNNSIILSIKALRKKSTMEETLLSKEKSTPCFVRCLTSKSVQKSRSIEPRRLFKSSRKAQAAAKAGERRDKKGVANQADQETSVIRSINVISGMPKPEKPGINPGESFGDLRGSTIQKSVGQKTPAIPETQHHPTAKTDTHKESGSERISIMLKNVEKSNREIFSRLKKFENDFKSLAREVKPPARNRVNSLKRYNPSFGLLSMTDEKFSEYANPQSKIVNETFETKSPEIRKSYKKRENEHIFGVASSELNSPKQKSFFEGVVRNSSVLKESNLVEEERETSQCGANTPVKMRFSKIRYTQSKEEDDEEMLMKGSNLLSNDSNRIFTWTPFSNEKSRFLNDSSGSFYQNHRNGGVGQNSPKYAIQNHQTFNYNQNVRPGSHKVKKLKRVLDRSQRKNKRVSNFAKKRKIEGNNEIERNYADTQNRVSENLRYSDLENSNLSFKKFEREMELEYFRDVGEVKRIPKSPINKRSQKMGFQVGRLDNANYANLVPTNFQSFTRTEIVKKEREGHKRKQFQNQEHLSNQKKVSEYAQNQNGNYLENQFWKKREAGGGGGSRGRKNQSLEVSKMKNKKQKSKQANAKEGKRGGGYQTGSQPRHRSDYKVRQYGKKIYPGQIHYDNKFSHKFAQNPYFFRNQKVKKFHKMEADEIIAKFGVTRPSSKGPHNHFQKQGKYKIRPLSKKERRSQISNQRVRDNQCYTMKAIDTMPSSRNKQPYAPVHHSGPSLVATPKAQKDPRYECRYDLSQAQDRKHPSENSLQGPNDPGYHTYDPRNQTMSYQNRHKGPYEPGKHFMEAKNLHLPSQNRNTRLRKFSDQIPDPQPRESSPNQKGHPKLFQMQHELRKLLKKKRKNKKTKTHLKSPISKQGKTIFSMHHPSQLNKSRKNSELSYQKPSESLYQCISSVVRMNSNKRKSYKENCVGSYNWQHEGSHFHGKRPGF